MSNLTCGRCGLSDNRVLDNGSGGAYHLTLSRCIERQVRHSAKLSDGTSVSAVESLARKYAELSRNTCQLEQQVSALRERLARIDKHVGSWRGCYCDTDDCGPVEYEGRNGGYCARCWAEMLAEDSDE